LRRLLIRPGGIGDCILALPALEYLKTDYTEVWVRSEIVPLIRFADSVRPIASTGLELMGLAGVDPPRLLIERLRSFHSIVSWYGANREEFRAQARELGLSFEFLSALPPVGERVHAADFFLGQVGSDAAGVPRIECAPRAAGEPFAVIHPFSGSSRKNWPMEKFRELSLRLGSRVQWSAGPQEKLEDAVRFGDLYELACWLASARVYVGNDSGITHLAAASGVPVAAIFGPSDPAIWAPRGQRVRVVAGSLGEITVDQVLEAVTELTGI
jgi:lipopolysaccharide heptosyltransferase III